MWKQFYENTVIAPIMESAGIKRNPRSQHALQLVLHIAQIYPERISSIFGDYVWLKRISDVAGDRRHGLHSLAVDCVGLSLYILLIVFYNFSSKHCLRLQRRIWINSWNLNCTTFYLANC